MESVDGSASDPWRQHGPRVLRQLKLLGQRHDTATQRQLTRLMHLCSWLSCRMIAVTCLFSKLALAAYLLNEAACALDDKVFIIIESSDMIGISEPQQPYVL